MRVTMVFYEGAYGPTFRIDVDEAGELLRLRHLSGDLEAQRVAAMRLEEHLAARAAGTKGVTLQTCAARRAPRQTVFRHKARGGFGEEPEFLWRATVEQWSTCGALVNRLL